MKKFGKIVIYTVFCALLSQGLSYAAQTIQGPTLGKISSPYGHRQDPYTGKTSFHKGMDIAAPKGTPIYALQEGFVTFSGYKKGYGKVVEIDHFYSDVPQIPRVQTKYAHNSKLKVKKGDYVKRGTVIAYVGSTGRSTGPHLHFEVSYKNKPINPMEYLTKLPSYINYAQKVRYNRYFAQKQFGRQVGGY